MERMEGDSARRQASAKDDSDGQPDDRRLERVLACVVHCLRETFPQDFHRRCAFSARAVLALLEGEGVEAQAVGGRFAALVVADSGERYALQGFRDGPELYPHLWVETDERLIDLGLYLLPLGSPFPAVAAPALAWPRATPLPAALSYEAIGPLARDAPFSLDPVIDALGARFVAACLGWVGRSEREDAFPSWIATGPASLAAAASAGDIWARSVERYEVLARSTAGLPNVRSAS